MGFCLPFIGLAAIIRKYLFSLNSLYEWLPAIRRTAGIVLIIIGVVIFFDLMQKGIGIIWSLY
jgi:cytochrome c-type biogenesis protein